MKLKILTVLLFITTLSSAQVRFTGVVKDLKGGMIKKKPLKDQH